MATRGAGEPAWVQTFHPRGRSVALYWSRVVRRLEATGHAAITVDRPGDDHRAGLAEYALVVDAILHYLMI